MIVKEDESSLNSNEPYSHEIGIEDWIHIMVDFEKSKYHLEDVISGLITFKKVSLKLHFMELQIIKKETLGIGAIIGKNINITKYCFYLMNKYNILTLP